MTEFRKLAETLADQLWAANSTLAQINEKGYADTEYFIMETWEILADARNAIQEPEPEKTDEQLLHDYSKEVLGSLYDPNNPITVEQLIEHSRLFRKYRGEETQEYRIDYRKGYDSGYKMGITQAGRNVIILDDLRKMNIQDLADLIRDS